MAAFAYEGDGRWFRYWANTCRRLAKELLWSDSVASDLNFLTTLEGWYAAGISKVQLAEIAEIELNKII